MAQNEEVIVCYITDSVYFSPTVLCFWQHVNCVVRILPLR